MIKLISPLFSPTVVVSSRTVNESESPGAIDAASSLEDLAGTAGFHALRGKPQRYAMSVNKNWRITFGWDEDSATAIDLEDYH